MNLRLTPVNIGESGFTWPMLPAPVPTLAASATRADGRQRRRPSNLAAEFPYLIEVTDS